MLYFDVTARGAEDKSSLDWMRKQFQKLNIQLVVRSTDYNRFQDKIRKGNAQIFEWGWNADYPDPENFLFLLHGPQQKVGNEGENASNYSNPEYNRLFDQMKNMENGPERQQNHRQDGRYSASRCALALGISSQGLRVVSLMVWQC